MEPLKFIKADEDTLELEGYIAVWGGDDLTDKIYPDRPAERFEEDTDFESAYTKTGRLLIDWEHGAQPDEDENGEKIAQPGEDDVLGWVEWTSRKKTEIGLLVRHVLNRRAAYMKDFVEPLARAGLLGTSSESVPGKIVRTEDGTITKWPLKRQTLTVMAMEPRLMAEMSEQQLTVIKSLAEQYPHLKALIPEAASTTATNDAAVNGGAKPDIDKTRGISGEGLEMGDKEKDEQVDVVTHEEIEDLTGQVKTVSEGLDKVLKWVDEQPSINDAGTSVEVIVDEADRPFKSFGEFLVAVVSASTPGGYKDPRLAAKATGLNEAIGAEGGFLVNVDQGGELLKRAYERAILASRVRRTPVGPNSNGLTAWAVNETARATGSRWGGLQSYWLGEGGTKTASKPAFREINLKLRKLIGMCYATDELLADSVALESIISEGFEDDFSWMLDDSIFNGLGGFQPLGFMASGALVSVTKESGQAADTIVSENIFKMYSRRLGNASGYVWLYNQDIEPQLYGLSLDVGTGGLPLYMPPGGISAAPYGSLLGLPMIAVEHAATVGDKGDLALVDLSQYILIDKGGTEKASSIHVNFTSDETVFRLVYRVDGQPIDAAPVTPANSALTQSAFIVLNARA